MNFFINQIQNLLSRTYILIILDIYFLKRNSWCWIIKSNENLYYIQNKRTKDSQFAIYRNVFKIITSKIIRDLDFNDQSLTNAEILQHLLNVGNNDNEIEIQGNKVYKILKDVIETGDIN